MDQRQIGLALTLRELSVPGDLSGFDSRLILQKAVYLVEEAGIHLGYGFNWYLRGPYSPALTRDLFDLNSDSEDVAGWVLDDNSRQIAQRVRALVQRKPDEQLSQTARRLELMASIRYLTRRGRLNPHDYAEARTQLAQNGKHFSESEIANAVQELHGAELL